MTIHPNHNEMLSEIYVPIYKRRYIMFTDLERTFDDDDNDFLPDCRSPVFRPVSYFIVFNKRFLHE